MPITINVGQQQSTGINVGDVAYIKGDDGFSPVIETEAITGGTRLTITDAEGQKQVDVMDGAPGQDGADGAPGRDGVDGAPGAAAGFGTPTATVDANVGTPSVEISASGPDTAKVFSFAFHNLKGSGGGSSDYDDLSDKPQIEGVTLSGNKTASDLGLAKASDIPTVPVQSVNGKTGAVVLGASDVGALPSSTAIPNKTSDLTNDSGYVNAAGAAAAAPVQSVNGNTGAVTVQPTITASGILKGNGSGGVSAAVAGTDYLTPATAYSPIKVVSANYSLTADDVGKTILTPNTAVTITLPSSVVSAVPIGAEFAFSSNYTTTDATFDLTAVTNPYTNINGTATRCERFRVTAGFDMVVIKRLSNATWGIYGNVEVVT